MEHLIIPKNYQSQLNLHDTQIAIKTVKDFFQNLLSLRLNLSRVSAPLFVDPDSGLNDNLNGVERPVTFTIKEQNEREIHFKRAVYAIGMYIVPVGSGDCIFTRQPSGENYDDGRQATVAAGSGDAGQKAWLPALL